MEHSNTCACHICRGYMDAELKTNKETNTMKTQTMKYKVYNKFILVKVYDGKALIGRFKVEV